MTLHYTKGNFFQIIRSTRHITSTLNRAYLIPNSWDDWFEFETSFSLYYVNEERQRWNIGALKIGHIDMRGARSADIGNRTPNLPESFDKLDKEYFSLGQDDTYYDNLNRLGDEARDKILIGLRDIAKERGAYEIALKERVTKVSLLRYVSPETVMGQFRRLANGGARLSDFSFSYTAPPIKGSSSPKLFLEFSVEHESNPPTNIHVLIGRNGVGKTHLINNMISSLIEPNTTPSKHGSFSFDNNEFFANLVSVTFSAFDETEPLPERKDKTAGIKYSYVGLKREKKSDEKSLAPKSPVMLKNEFVKSVLACKSGAKNTRWKNTLEMLEADPIFKEAEIANVAEGENEEELNEKASFVFKNLSSGHKIVLLTITRLVETVEERSLVLIDEPEAHLHPPLLSAFIRALSYLLIQRNGVAIIATHSPVVLQEVPKNCVWKLRRNGIEAKVERLETESFGENVGALTREVFGLEVTHSGFHKLLTDAVAKKENYEDAVQYFSDQLGNEARAIIRALVVSRNNEEG